MSTTTTLLASACYLVAAILGVCSMQTRHRDDTSWTRLSLAMVLAGMLSRSVDVAAQWAAHGRNVDGSECFLAGAILVRLLIMQVRHHVRSGNEVYVKRQVAPGAATAPWVRRV